MVKIHLAKVISFIEDERKTKENIHYMVAAVWQDKAIFSKVPKTVSIELTATE